MIFGYITVCPVSESHNLLYVLPLGYGGRPGGLWIAVTCYTGCSHCDGLCCGRWRLGHQDDPHASSSETLIQNHVLPMVIWLIHLIFYFFFWLLIRYPIWRYWLWNRKFSLILKLIRHSICATDHHWMIFSFLYILFWLEQLSEFLVLCFSAVTEVLGLPWGDQRPSPAAPDDVSTTAPRWSVTAGCGRRGDPCDTIT